jgi:tetratricopeptide (TPR) repeat protein
MYHNNCKLNKPPAYIVILTTLVLILPVGCSVKKNTGLSRTYHNLTAKYNVLFNGKESFKKGTTKIDVGFKDNFAEILPVFPFTEKKGSSLASTDMDRTIKKCAKLISMHSITAKPRVKNSKNLTPKQREFFSKKEYNAFVDDAYLLMGKAHFYKLEFTEASEIFHMILNDFKNQSVIPETQVWLARLLIETGQYKDAYEILNLLLNNTDFPKKLLPELYPTFAEYYLKQKDYIQAISYLQKSLLKEKHKKNRTRYYYILAQLFEKTGDLKQASENYSFVVKMNPVYDMAFNARINRALAFQQGFGKADEIEYELTKMLRDDKNTEYRDQIYFAIGNLCAKEGNYTKAIENYKKSVDATVDNEQQRTRTYLTLANLYYSFPDYPDAQAYYDSALIQIQPDYPGYEALFTKSKSLTRLVKELNTYQLEDSVLKLAKLPQQELYARIDAIIESERKKEELERQRQQEQQLDQQFGNEVAIQNFAKQQKTPEGTRWYFYNDAAKSMGYREFRLTWGNRKLEDHWQRAVKTASAFAAGGTEENEQAEEVTTRPANSFNKMSREYYMVNIPKTDSAVTASLKRLEQAEYNMGVIYKTDLKDYDKASASFKDLIKRFPATEYLLSAYFHLYSVAKEQNNQAMTDYYKNIIAGQFPESMYARVLTNPAYIQELEQEDNKIRQYYADTYDMYKSGNYAEVTLRSDYALKNFKDNSLIPQFTYLGILSSGKNSDRKIFHENLKAIIAKYPGSEIAGDAQNLVDYMDKKHPEIKEAQDRTLSLKLYQVNFNSEHLFAFVVDKKMNVNQLIFNMINFNLDNYDKLNLRVEVADVNTRQNLIVVKPFPGKSEVMEYLNAIRSSEAIYKDIPGISLIPLAISVENYNILKTEKSADLYLKFFNENYH